MERQEVICWNPNVIGNETDIQLIRYSIDSFGTKNAIKFDNILETYWNVKNPV